MGIDGINNNGQVSWSSFLNAVEDASKAGKLGDVSVKKEGSEITFSVNENEGMRAVTFSFPELDVPEIIDQAAIDSLVTKLTASNDLQLNDEQAQALKERLTALYPQFVNDIAAEAESSTSSTSGVFFNLYQLMVLLAEVAQELRDSTREIRQAESETIANSIQNQADKQRSAALTGLITGVILGAVQLTISVGCTISQASGFKNQLAAQKNEGLSQAQANLKMAEMQSAPQDATANYNKLADQLGSAKAQHVLDSFNDSQAAKTTYSNSQQRVQTLEARKAELTAKQAAHEADPAKPALTEAEQTELHGMDQQITDAKVQMEDARQNYCAALKSEASQARTAYNDAKHAAENPPAGTTKADIEALQSAKAEAQVRAEFAEAYAAKELSVVQTGQEKALALDNAKAEYRLAESRVEHTAGYLMARHRSDMSRTVHDITNATINMGQSILQSITSMINAEATRMGAEQKEAEEQLDEVKDLFQGAGDLSNAVLQLMQAIQQSENDSMQEAIRA